MQKIFRLYQKCRKSGCRFFMVLIRHALLKSRGLNIMAHQKVSIKGQKNIETRGRLQIGMSFVGFMHKSDRTLLNIRGKALFLGDYSIGRGCRIDIAENATLEVGHTGYVNANTRFIIHHHLKIGQDCAISWDCQFLDDDFHSISYEGKKEKEEGIEIGNHVWIGNYVKIYKGTRIPDGCVIAADSSVRGIFTEKNCLIAGNPARVVKEGVRWE